MLLRSIIILLTLLLPCAVLADDRAIKRKPVANESRTALVIGNAAYADAPLANPVHDAEDMAAALRRSGFKVNLYLNSNRRQMKKAIQALGDQLRYGGVGLFYFAGHGIQVNGTNYLVPVGADVKTEADIEFEAVDANRVLAQMQTADNRLNMVFLDACRNNPYKRSFRSASNGLAAMDAPRGSLVSFATAPGNVAADGTGRNGIYTKHLLRQMAKKDLEIGRMMRQVRRGVQEDTREQQTPFELSSLTGDFYFYPSNAVGGAVPTPPVDVPLNGDEMWQAVRESDKPEELRLFLSEFPNSSHRGMANLRLIRLERVYDGSRFKQPSQASIPAEEKENKENKPQFSKQYFIVVSSVKEIESGRLKTRELLGKRFKAALFYSSSKYYAVTIGPFIDKQSAQQFKGYIVSSGIAPPDSYISTGGRFIEKIALD